MTRELDDAAEVGRELLEEIGAKLERRLDAELEATKGSGDDGVRSPELELPSSEVTPAEVARRTKELVDETLVVEVAEVRSGRVTGWRVKCPEHGGFPIELRGRDRAVIVAGRHVQAEHGGRGKVKVRRARAKRAA